MKQYKRYKDIPQFKAASSSYAIDCMLNYLDNWVESQKEDGLNLTPEFQRGHVWTEAQQIAYIEFLLRGGTSGRDIYFNYPSQHHAVKEGAYNEFVCVDGLQRMTAALRFVNNEIPAFGTYFCEFEDHVPLNLSLRIHVNDLQNEGDVLEWYLEMNTGGTPHEKEELARVKKMLEATRRKEGK